MSKKKKGQAKADETTESTNEIEAVPAKAAPAKPAAQVAAKAPAKTEDKKEEVIPAVKIALLETYPSLPDKDLILLAFAEHYSDAQTRAVAAAEEAKKAVVVAPEPPKSRRTRYVTNPQMPTMSPPPSPTASAPKTPPPAPRPVATYTPPPIVEAAPEPMYEPEPEYTPEPEPQQYLMEDEGTPGPQVAFGNDADDAALFGANTPSDDDIFSALDKKKESADEELGFTPSSDYSDPFIRTAGSSEPSDPFAAMPSFEQVQSAPVEEVAPNDRTMMIPAYNPPEEEAEAAPEPEAEAADAGAQTGRKGRRGSKKKK